MHSSSRGFTLIEMLVVLVILSLTTAMLANGLATTWKNFEKLGARNLLADKGNLPQQWFRKSFHGALLSHPEKTQFSGDPNRIAFVTMQSPDSINSTPTHIVWHLIPNDDNGTSLAFSTTHSPSLIIATLAPKTHFEYLVDQQWLNEFKPIKGFLPQAIRIMENETEWELAVVKRPTSADVPVEFPIFGAYEF